MVRVRVRGCVCVLGLGLTLQAEGYLLEFVGDHGKSLEDGVCGSSDGDDPLWTISLRNIDPGCALLAGRWWAGNNIYVRRCTSKKAMKCFLCV